MASGALLLLRRADGGPLRDSFVHFFCGEQRPDRDVTRQVVSIVPPDGAGGVAVALRIEGRSLFFNYGWADRANKRPITTDTLFNLRRAA